MAQNLGEWIKVFQDPSIPQEENENGYQIYLDFDELRLHVAITRVNKKNENAIIFSQIIRGGK